MGKGDEKADLEYMVNKITGLRAFEDDNGKMNHSILDTGGELLVVSQFTLFGDCRKGRRPSFTAAADSAVAQGLYDDFIIAIKIKKLKCPRVFFRQGWMCLWSMTARLLLCWTEKKYFNKKGLK